MGKNLKDRRRKNHITNEFSDSELRVVSGKSFHYFIVEDRKYSE